MLEYVTRSRGLGLKLHLKHVILRNFMRTSYNYLVQQSVSRRTKLHPLFEFDVLCMCFKLTLKQYMFKTFHLVTNRHLAYNQLNTTKCN